MSADFAWKVVEQVVLNVAAEGYLHFSFKPLPKALEVDEAHATRTLTGWNQRVFKRAVVRPTESTKRLILIYLFFIIKILLHFWFRLIIFFFFFLDLFG
jgi:hypothetical protein